MISLQTDGLVSAVTIVGLLIDGFGAILIVGRDIGTVHRLAKRLFSRYRHLSNALDTLSNGGTLVYRHGQDTPLLSRQVVRQLWDEGRIDSRTELEISGYWSSEMENDNKEVTELTELFGQSGVTSSLPETADRFQYIFVTRLMDQYIPYSTEFEEMTVIIDVADDTIDANTIEWSRVVLEVTTELDRILIRNAVSVLLIGFFIQILAQTINLLW